MTSSISFELDRGYCRNILESQLMENYVHNVVTLLQPIPHRHNTYSSLYVPNALLGSAKLRGGLARGSSGKIAIFFSLLATSAFNLRGTNTTSSFDEVARTLRLKAFDWLQMALEELSELDHGERDVSRFTVSHMYETAISAILTLITADIMEGSMTEYLVHLDGVNKICDQLRDGDQSIELDQRLVTISSFLTVLSATTSIDLLPMPWPTKNAFSHSRSNIFNDGWGLEITYGITATLANYLQQITTLSQHISYFISQSLPIYPTLLSACHDFSKTLSSWSIESENLSSLPAANCNIFLAKSHILAFAQSLQIYFHTRVLPCTDAEMAQYVQCVAEYLTEIEAVRVQQEGNKLDLTASIMWPGFIASCEAGPDARDVWHQWWNGMLKYQIGNISKLWVVVKEAWAMRDEGLKEVPAWMPVLRCTGTKILAV
jgi:arginine metabolism regulation protein II